MRGRHILMRATMIAVPEPSLFLAQREAGDSTSWSVAKAVLPVLTTL